MSKQITMYDTTLRDGTQGDQVNLSAEDKLRIAKKLDEYGIDLMLLPRGWMTQELRKERGWLTLFENVNAGLYLRRGPGTEADIERVQRYYDQRGIPFDSELGFEERRAFEANRAWANGFAIRRTHYQQFRMSFRLLQRGRVRRVKGW